MSSRLKIQLYASGGSFGQERLHGVPRKETQRDAAGSAQTLKMVDDTVSQLIVISDFVLLCMEVGP